jgi:guanylate kinase
VVIAGPSCVGKSPLFQALAQFHPDLAASLQPVVLYNDRPPRPGEVDGEDYHFRPRREIEALKERPGHAVLEVRGDLQAVDIDALKQRLARGDALFEGNPFIARLLLEHPALAGLPRLAIFVSPLGRDEIERLRREGADPAEVTADVMRRKLLRRTRRFKGELSRPDLEEVERRAGSAWRELGFASAFDHVIINHDGEDSEHWDAFPRPIGDAGRSLETLVALLREEPADTERWPPGFPQT